MSSEVAGAGSFFSSSTMGSNTALRSTTSEIMNLMSSLIVPSSEVPRENLKSFREIVKESGEPLSFLLRASSGK